MNSNIFIKPMTWAGKRHFYIGHEPSKPEAYGGYENRLGSYFLILHSIDSARSVAASFGRPVVECEHYVGY